MGGQKGKDGAPQYWKWAITRDIGHGNCSGTKTIHFASLRQVCASPRPLDVFTNVPLSILAAHNFASVLRNQCPSPIWREHFFSGLSSVLRTCFLVSSRNTEGTFILKWFFVVVRPWQVLAVLSVKLHADKPRVARFLFVPFSQPALVE